MSFIHINIILTCVLFLPYGELTYTALSLRQWPFDGPNITYVTKNEYAGVQQYFYSYTYSKGRGDVVNFACAADQSVNNPVLNWQIVRSELKHTSCPEYEVQEINYIAKLDETQIGNNLTCFLKGPPIATATITFLCPQCDGSIARYFNAKCFNYTDSIATYVNGEFSKEQDREVYGRKGETITVHCEIKVDNKHEVTLGNVPHDLVRDIYRFSKSVIVYKVIMSHLWDKKHVTCQKVYIETSKIVRETNVLFKMLSLYIVIYQTGSVNKTWNIDQQHAELSYNDNDTVQMSCRWNGDVDVPMEWLKNNSLVKRADVGKRVDYTVNLTLEHADVEMACQMKTDDEVHLKHSIIFKYNDPNTKQSTLEGEPTTKHNDQYMNTGQMSVRQNDDKQWIWLGIAIVVVVVIITFAAYKYKSWRSATPSVLRNEISYINFQNTYTVPERPVLDPTYSGPVDDVNTYSYTYNQKPIQDTYSTPFAPTIEEMYAKPTPKNSRSGKDPVYQLPGKFTYANLRGARQNQQDPGYSNVTEDAGDNTSETYTYCSIAGYNRPG